MNYAQVVSMLFPAYIVGCLMAVSLSWSWRSLCLSLSYSYLLIVFQFFISGRAVEFGANTFLYCAYAQLVMGFCGAFLGNRILAIGSLFAVILNAGAAVAFVIGDPIRQLYFVGVNIIQTVQILSLIAMSPAAVRLYRLVKRDKRNLPWAIRAASG